ncbi:MAG: hypothetical protein H8K03_21160 [Nitrospira sp.]
MIIRDEIRQFMVVSESLLDGTLKVEELTHIELELLEYCLLKVGQKVPINRALTHYSIQDNADLTSQSLPSRSTARRE